MAVGGDGKTASKPAGGANTRARVSFVGYYTLGCPGGTYISMFLMVLEGVPGVPVDYIYGIPYRF